jgi:hypothetical protein
MNYTNLSDDDDEELENKKEDLDSENDVVISKEKVEMNVSFIAIGNISLRNPKMVVVSSESESDPNSVMIRVKDSRKGNVLSLRRHKQGSAISISQMNSLLIQSLSSFKSPKPRWSSARDSEMLSARSEIEKVSLVHDFLGLNPLVYRNISKFLR